MIYKLKKLLVFSICFTGLIGCSNNSIMYRYDDTNNDSLLVQRDIGAKVFIAMSNGEEYKGELLRVLDSTMVLSKEYELSEEDLSDLTFPFYSINNHDIKKIELVGENHLMGGIIFGGLIGIVLATILSYAILSSGNYHPFGYIALCFGGGGVVGMLIGGIIGNSNTTYDKVVYKYANSGEYDFTKLNIYSRYGGKEPN